ncbi:MAG: FtsX-like permease family protein [Planctomycetota bacterium]|jgi:putative ABC transport system permease protein|nr:FtsX-like permease family protein [Planctomycetota bacterium]
MNLLLRALWRWHARHPVLLAVTVLGAALGAASVIAIDLANASSRRAFDHAVRGLTGQATHQIHAGTVGIDEQWYVDLQRGRGGVLAAPVVRGQLRLHDGAPLELFGIDPFAEATVRPAIDAALGSAEHLITEPGAVAAGADLVARRGWQLGDTISVRSGQDVHQLRLRAVLEPRDELTTVALRDVLICDIATAQETLGLLGRLSRIDLVMEPSARLEPPPGAVLRPASSQRAQLADMTAAFHLNLTALSLLALGVAAFLVYNALGFALLQRRGIIARLRAVGATPGQIATALLAETALLGLAASAIGIAIGWVLGGVLLEQIGTTISDLYLARDVARVELGLASVGKALATGLGVALVAGAVPIIEAWRVTPREQLQRAGPQRNWSLALFGVALVLALVAVVLLQIDERSIALAFVATGVALAAGACAVPLVLRAWCGLGAALFSRLGRPLATMIWRAPAQGLRRSGVAAAALSLAVAAALGVGIMVASFRGTLIDWLDATLGADIYASAGAGLTSEDRPLQQAFIDAVRAAPEVSAVTLRRDTTVHGREHSYRAIVVDPSRPQLPPLRAGTLETVWPRFIGDDAVVVSEQLAWRRGLGLGDTIALQTEHGWHEFSVVAITADFAGDRGLLYWHATTFARHFVLPPADGLAAELSADADVDVVCARLARHPAAEGLALRSQRALRTASLQVFDRTFLVTEALRVIAAAVAVLSVVSAIAALAVERRSALALLRARGATPGQVWALGMGECGVLGLFCGVIAVPAGLGLAALLTLVINRRSFGWTLNLDPQPGQWLPAVLTALIAALIAGLVPTWRAARATPAEAMRDG